MAERQRNGTRLRLKRFFICPSELTCLWKLGLGQADSRNQCFIPGVSYGQRGSNYLSHHCCLSGSIWKRSWNWPSSQNSNPSNLIWDVIIQRGIVSTASVATSEHLLLFYFFLRIWSKPYMTLPFSYFRGIIASSNKLCLDNLFCL